MPITIQELTALEGRINAVLAPHKTKIVLTAHVAGHRVNDPRNTPPITLKELESILHRFAANHIKSALALLDQSTFNLRCATSDINMPCGLSKALAFSNGMHEISVITVIRKRGFVAKDPVEFNI